MHCLVKGHQYTDHCHVYIHNRVYEYDDHYPFLPIELLRCFGESTLVDLVQLMFTRLPSFPEDPQDRDHSSAMDQVCTSVAVSMTLFRTDFCSVFRTNLYSEKPSFRTSFQDIPLLLQIQFWSSPLFSCLGHTSI